MAFCSKMYCCRARRKEVFFIIKKWHIKPTNFYFLLSRLASPKALIEYLESHLGLPSLALSLLSNLGLGNAAASSSSKQINMKSLTLPLDEEIEAALTVLDTSFMWTKNATHMTLNPEWGPLLWHQLQNRYWRRGKKAIRQQWSCILVIHNTETMIDHSKSINFMSEVQFIK